MLVKICGVKDVESARVALDSGANMIGMIFVPGKPRTVDHEVAKEIVKLVSTYRTGYDSQTLLEKLPKGDDSSWFEDVHDELVKNGPYAVGVFRNQSIEDIIKIQNFTNIDFIQLHGKEPRDEYIKAISRPVITRFVPNEPEVLDSLKPNKQILTLFDSEAGGEGIKLNWGNLSQWSLNNQAKYVLAGGLTPGNVGEAVKLNGVIGVDVSGGVETEGVKDHTKIREFIENATKV